MSFILKDQQGAKATRPGPELTPLIFKIYYDPLPPITSTILSILLTRYYWGQSARTHVPTQVIDTATMTQQNLTRLNLDSIHSRLHRLNSRLLTVTSNLIMVAHARILLPQAAHAFG